MEDQRQELLDRIERERPEREAQIITDEEPMNERHRLAEIEILAHCRHLNFHAIATLFKDYGFDDPENTVGRLKELDVAVRNLEKAKSVAI